MKNSNLKSQISKPKLKTQNFVSKSERETLKFVESFAGRLHGGEVIGLIGELGAGKTVFTKGLAAGLGVEQAIQSPTFLLMKIYEVRKSESPAFAKTSAGRHQSKIKHLIHVDAYRLSGAAELVDVGLLDWLGRADAVTVIEWADKVPELLHGEKVIKIKMELGEKEEERKIEVTGNA